MQKNISMAAKDSVNSPVNCIDGFYWRRCFKGVPWLVFCSALIGCPLVANNYQEEGSQSLLQRALMLEQQNAQEDLVGQIESTSKAHYEFLIGELALAREQPLEAIEHFASAAELEEDAAPTLRLRLAGLYLQEKRLDEALAQLQIVTSELPDDVGALQLKAGVLAALGKEKEAIASYNRLIELKGSSSEEPYIFAASLHLQANQLEEAKELLLRLLGVHERSFFGNYYLARISEAQSKYDEAENYYQRALVLSPRADSVRISLAKLYGAQRKYDQGLKVVDEILQRDSSNVEAKKLKGQLLVGKNEFDEAIDEFEEVSGLEEDSSKTRFRIGLIKLQRRNVQGAITDFNLVLAQNPDDAAARYYLSSAYSSLGQIADAIEQIKAIGPKQEYFVESRTLGAFLLQRAKRYSEAIDLLEDVVSTNEDASLFRFLATLYKDNGDIGRAIEISQRVCELEPDSDQSFFTLGVYLDQDGQKEAAITAMRKAIELNGNNANALNYLGYTFAERGTNLDEARELITKALVIEPNNGYYIDSLGWVLYKSGEFDQALQELKRAAELVPNDAVILEHLALAYKDAGKLDLARETAEKALEFAPESEDTSVTSRLKKLLSTLP